jgi:hypothetical protein
MISLKCPKCGFFFSVSLPANITEEEREEALTCPCGTRMKELELTNAQRRAVELLGNGEEFRGYYDNCWHVGSRMIRKDTMYVLVRNGIVEIYADGLDRYARLVKEV